MKKRITFALFIFILSFPVYASTLSASSIINTNSSYKTGDLIYIDHKTNNTAEELKDVKYINIYHSFDSSALDFVGIMSTQAVEYCNFRDSDFMTCSVVQNNRFKASEVFATTVYKVKKSLATATKLDYSYNSNITKDKSKTTTIVLEEKVNQVKLQDLSAKTDIHLIRGEIYRLELELSPSTVSYSDLSYSSSNETIASVDNSGQVFARNVGIAKIKVEKDGLSETINIEVQDDTIVHASSVRVIIPTIIITTLVIFLVIAISKFLRRQKEERNDIYIGE